MKFGICVLNWEPFAYSPRIYEELAVEAEALGFDSFLVTDHLMRPAAPGLTPKQHSTLEAWTLLAHLAGKTKVIRLGTCVSPIPMRNPQLLAKMAATVDVLSEGRVILGVGAGWDRGELDAYSEYRENGERVGMTAEGIRLIRRLWAEETVNFEGRFYRAKDAVLEPKPVQRNGPPIWSGAIHDRMLRLTAQEADCWIPSRALGATPDYYAKMNPELSRYENVARRKEGVLRGVMGYFVGPGASSALPSIGPMERAEEFLEKYGQAGCQYVAVMFFPVPDFKSMMRKFASDIAPSFG